MNRPILWLGLATIGLSFASPVGATNASSDAAPTADLKILSGNAVTADWYGDGSLSLRKSLCIDSNTGRYVLHIVNGSGQLSQGSSGAAAIQIRFSDAGGIVDTKPIIAGAEITFSGASPRIGDNISPACSDGPNAKLEILVPEALLQASQAGSYFDELSLSVQPN